MGLQPGREDRLQRCRQRATTTNRATAHDRRRRRSANPRAGGVKPGYILYVLVGNGQDVQFNGGGGVNCCAAIVDGMLLAPYRNIALSQGLANDGLISGQDISIVSGSSVRCPCQ